MSPQGHLLGVGGPQILPTPPQSGGAPQDHLLGVGGPQTTPTTPQSGGAPQNPPQGNTPKRGGWWCYLGQAGVHVLLLRHPEGRGGGYSVTRATRVPPAPKIPPNPPKIPPGPARSHPPPAPPRSAPPRAAAGLQICPLALRLAGAHRAPPSYWFSAKGGEGSAPPLPLCFPPPSPPRLPCFSLVAFAARLRKGGSSAVIGCRPRGRCWWLERMRGEGGREGGRERETRRGHVGGGGHFSEKPELSPATGAEPRGRGRPIRARYGGGRGLHAPQTAWHAGPCCGRAVARTGGGGKRQGPVARSPLHTLAHLRGGYRALLPAHQGGVELSCTLTGGAEPRGTLSHTHGVAEPLLHTHHEGGAQRRCTSALAHSRGRGTASRAAAT